MSAERWSELCPRSYRTKSEGGLTEVERLSEMARAALIRLAGAFSEEKGVLIRGEAGTGKTRVMWRLLRKRFEKGQTIQAMTSGEFERNFREASGGHSIKPWFDALAGCDCPFIDDLVRPNPDDPTGRSTMRRVPEVLDCWFESGSMPFAQVHYPFENREWFEHHYPGDFIVEYIGQTRGWFYTLHVLATALFDRPSFTTCVSHGIVLGNDGQKMSKSYDNTIEVFEELAAQKKKIMRTSSATVACSRLPPPTTSSTSSRWPTTI